MSQKPPPALFSRSESIRLMMTPKMLRAVAVAVGLALIPPGARTLLHPEPPKIGPIPLPVPTQEWTTEAKGWVPIPAILTTLPPPDPRQKNVECRKALGQVILEGACWQRLDVEPPCPTDEGAFEHDKDHKCYVRVLRAERPKQSGEPQLVNVAGEP